MSAGEPPVLRVAGGLERALDAAVLRTLASDDLARFLAAQRWFGGKARTPSTVAIAEVIPVSWDGDVAAVVRLLVETGDAPAASYQLPLVAREAEMSRANAPRAVLALIDAGGVRGVLFDALEDHQFRTRLARSLAHGASFAGSESAEWRIAPVGAGAGTGAEGIVDVPSRVVGGEQSNTSVVYGERAICKLFRKLEPGENPDVEITRFLTTRTTFRHTPELLGTIHFRGADGETCVAGMLSRYLPKATDGWEYALGRLRTYLRAPGATEPANPFAAEAERLGAITRELHEALASDPASPEFTPELVTARDIDAWAGDARRSIDGALELLRARAGGLDAKTAAMARAIAGRRDDVLDRLEEIVAAVRTGGDGAGGASGAGIAAHKVRHHGDYHLGQVLRTADGDWMIIDFEGEPARPLAVRRAPSSPLRDVAGMVRSLAYAAATGAAEVGGVGVNPTVEVRAARWERDARGAFLAGYGAAADDPLLALFEVEKVFYELSYELNNRPAWAWIPLRGVAKLF
jgi:trehalose synthase-fused probable maltokinase